MLCCAEYCMLWCDCDPALLCIAGEQLWLGGIVQLILYHDISYSLHLSCIMLCCVVLATLIYSLYSALSHTLLHTPHTTHHIRWLRTVETVGRQYAFIKFDRVIQKRRRDYLDPNSSANLKKLNDDLQSIHNIMRKTIDDVLDRGNKLDGMCYCSYMCEYVCHVCV